MDMSLPSGRGLDDVLRDVRTSGGRRRRRNQALVLVPLVLTVSAVVALGGNDPQATRVLTPAGPEGRTDTSEPTNTTVAAAPSGTGPTGPAPTAPGASPPVLTPPRVPATHHRATIPPGTAGETNAVEFTAPLSLGEAIELAAAHKGILTALWRTDTACVPDVDGQYTRPGGNYGKRKSAFAYYEADDLVSRQNQGPPATDGGWSTALRERFVKEWDAAQKDGVQFRGAVFLVPEGQSFDQSRFRATTPVESYVTDAGVLYLRDHETHLEPLFPGTESGEC